MLINNINYPLIIKKHKSIKTTVSNSAYSNIFINLTKNIIHIYNNIKEFFNKVYITNQEIELTPYNPRYSYEYEFI